MNVEQLSARSVKAVKNAMNAIALTSLVKPKNLTKGTGTNKYFDLKQETTLNEQIITRTKCEDR